MEAAEVKAWRRSERGRLLALRLAMPPAARRVANQAIAEQVYAVLAERPRITVGAYWPFQGEFDPRPLLDRLIAEGWRAALPAVVDKKGPLEYRLWRPGDPLVAGIWDIPVPERRVIAMPDAVLAPLVGFDRQSYRLGYGGGYFDRTLAALRPRPLAIGVGYELSRIETIYPQTFDVPMGLIVTEAEPRRRRSAVSRDDRG
jgi:5,10-methenyltetrahydrofolate synthetase